MLFSLNSFQRTAQRFACVYALGMWAHAYVATGDVCVDVCVSNAASSGAAMRREILIEEREKVSAAAPRDDCFLCAVRCDGLVVVES